MKSIADVHEDVEAVIDIHFFVEFSKTKSSTLLKKVMNTQNAIERSIFKKDVEIVRLHTQVGEDDT